MMSKRIFLFVAILLILSCTSEDDFENLVKRNGNDFQELYTIGNNGLKYSTMEYKKVYLHGEKINCFLLKKAYSEENTNWVFGSIPTRLTKGDIALMLLIEINSIDSGDLMVNENYISTYPYNFWEYIHSNLGNREKVINEIIFILSNTRNSPDNPALTPTASPGEES